MLTERPFFGVGLGNYPSYVKKYHQPGMDPMVLAPDNEFLMWVAETGFLGSFFSLIFLGLFLGKLKLYLQNHGSSRVLSAAIAGVAGTFCALFFLDGFTWVPIQYGFWSLVGLCLGLTETKSAQGAARGISEKNEKRQHLVGT